MKDLLLVILVMAVLWLMWGEIKTPPQPPNGTVIVVTAPSVPVEPVMAAPGMATAVPYEDWAGTLAIPTTAVPDTVIISPPVVWTAVPPAMPTPTPLPPSTGLLAIVARYGETTVQRCMMAMAAGELLDLQCRTIEIEMQAIGGE